MKELSHRVQEKRDVAYRCAILQVLTFHRGKVPMPVLARKLRAIHIQFYPQMARSYKEIGLRF